jgi:putative oxidoreductase
MSLLRKLGQMCLAAIFISGGWQAFVAPGGRVRAVEKAGMPEPETLVILNGAVMTVGGTLLALDLAPKATAAALLASLVPTTLVGHAFWNESNESTRKAQQTQFMKNLGMIGGLLLVLAEK